MAGGSISRRFRATTTFTGTTRVPIEVGPTGAYTSNLVVSDNWSANMNNAGTDPNGMSTAVAYSIISTNGVNTLMSGNYAQGPGGNSVGIELDGSGQITAMTSKASPMARSSIGRASTSIVTTSSTGRSIRC